MLSISLALTSESPSHCIMSDTMSTTNTMSIVITQSTSVESSLVLERML
jgi:hypothetical protein